MRHSFEDIQRALKGAGFDPGGIDGIPGRKTKAAVKAFQMAHGLVPDGIAGPLTQAVLFPDEDITPEDVVATQRPWFDLAISKMGLHEKKDHRELMRFLKSDGSTLGDPAELPWCGDFVETCIALTCPEEPMIANPYLARNWQNFGRDCEPQVGAIAVYWRTHKTNSTNGHVAFLAGQEGDEYGNVGGNQGNRVSLSNLKKDRLLTCRWPLTMPMPKVAVLPKMRGGELSINEA